MQVIYSSRGPCTKTRKYLDYYISGELSVEASLELTRHLAACRSCLGELKTRKRLKHRLRRAVLRQVTPPYLRAQVLKKIGQTDDVS
jgi:anti-sigma factor RsiW